TQAAVVSTSHLSNWVHLYFAANIPARFDQRNIDKKIKHYQALTDGNNALLNLSFTVAQQGKWDDAVTYLEACADIKEDNDNLKIAKVMKAARRLADFTIFKDANSEKVKEARVKTRQLINALVTDGQKCQDFFSQQLPVDVEAYRLFAGIAGSRGYLEMQALTLEAALNLAVSGTTPDKETEIKALKDTLTSLYRKTARDSKDNGEKDKNYQNLLRHSSEDLEANLSLARTNYHDRKLDEAVKYYSKVLESQPEHLEARVIIARNHFSQHRWKESYEHYHEILSLAQKERMDWMKKYRETKQLSSEENTTLIAEDIATFTPTMKLWYQSTGDATAFLFVCYQLRNNNDYHGRAEKHLSEATVKALYSGFHPELANLHHFLGSMWMAAKEKVNLTTSKARIKHFGYDLLTIPKDKLDGEVLKLALEELEKLVDGTKK
ncbi:MAG: tetratricopeptide repeat protein, partial [Nanoarchaeota archaeon]